MASALLLLAACSREAAIEGPRNLAGDKIVVQSAIAREIVSPIFDLYTGQTGTRIVLAAGELPGDHADSGAGPQADLLIVGDLVALARAVDENMLRPIRSPLIESRIPAMLRDPEHAWIALGVRTRAVVFNPQLVGEPELGSLDDYASLAGESWHGRLCLSSSGVAGNTSLIARLISDLGIRETEMVVRRWRSNLNHPVFADDAALLRAVAARDCDIGIADGGEFRRFVEANGQAEIALHRFSTAGTSHVELSAAGVARHAANADGAVSLLEWLTGGEVNARLAAALYESPARPQAAGELQLAMDPAGVAHLVFLLEDAALLAERARYP